MRVLHLTATTHGGAGLAAVRLHRALRDIDVDSVLGTRFVAEEFEEDRSVHKFEIPMRSKVASRVLREMNVRLNRSEDTYLSVLQLETLRHADVRKFEPDIVHLHNGYNFSSWKTVQAIRGLGAAPVITLHDQRWFTGGCHYSLECEGFRSTCTKCPQVPRSFQIAPALEHQRVTRMANKSGAIAVISPSAWLTRLAKVSTVFKDKDVVHIPNCLPLEAYTSSNSESARLRFDIADDQLVIACLSRKRPQLLREIINELKESSMANRVTFLTVGSGFATDGPIDVISLDTLKTERERLNFWAAADVAMHLTAADNFPNAIIEALAVGTPVVVPDIGGAGEAAIRTGGGMVVRSHSIDYVRAIENLASEHNCHGLLSDRALSALDVYAPWRIAAKHVELYEAQLSLK